jgi:hypothetical protein
MFLFLSERRKIKMITCMSKTTRYFGHHCARLRRLQRSGVSALHAAGGGCTALTWRGGPRMRSYGTRSPLQGFTRIIEI